MAKTHHAMVDLDENRRDAAGRPRVRIHAVGFPVIFSAPGVSELTGIRFATLMRVLCYKMAGRLSGWMGSARDWDVVDPSTPKSLNLGDGAGPG